MNCVYCIYDFKSNWTGTSPLVLNPVRACFGGGGNERAEAGSSGRL